MLMVSGSLYFIKDEYFKDFPDDKLMKNKEKSNGKLHNRPCYYNFYDKNTSVIWVIPISSKVEKYEEIYNKIVNKSKKKECDTIVFGYILGEKRAFLIQNMCPVIDKYIDDIYIDKAIQAPVVVDSKIQKELNIKAKKVLGLYKRGIQLIQPNVKIIEKALLAIINEEVKSSEESA